MTDATEEVLLPVDACCCTSPAGVVQCRPAPYAYCCYTAVLLFAREYRYSRLSSEQHRRTVRFRKYILAVKLFLYRGNCFVYRSIGIAHALLSMFTTSSHTLLLLYDTSTHRCAALGTTNAFSARCMYRCTVEHIQLVVRLTLHSRRTRLCTSTAGIVLFRIQ